MPNNAILSESTGTPLQAVRYVLARPHGEYSDESVDTIVRAYWAQCAAVGVDPVMVVAQLIHETGGLAAWWAQRPRRNPAGIGVTGHSVSREAFEASPARYPDRSWAWVAGDRADLTLQGDVSATLATWTGMGIVAEPSDLPLLGFAAVTLAAGDVIYAQIAQNSGTDRTVDEAVAQLIVAHV